MIDKSVLDNGVTVVSRKMAHVRSVSMGVWVNVGARDESDAQNGLSHFIEHMIFKGTARRSAFQIAKEFDAIGGQTNAFTSMEHTCYHAKVLDTHLETMVDILLDIFLNSTFDPAEIERERTVIFQEIGMVEDSPEEFLHLLSGRNFWGSHPLGRSILGTRENILKFDARTINAFFRQFYHPERIVLAVAGNVDHQRIVDLVGPAFETIHNGPQLPPREFPRVTPRQQAVGRELEQVHINLATLGLSATDPRRFACALMNTILGGNMSSRLFQEIRETHGLAYSVYSYVASHADSGMFGVYAGVHPDQVERAVDLLVKAMKRLKKESIPSAELEGAKEFTKGNLILATESVDNQMVRLAQNQIHFGKFVPLQTVIDRIDGIDADDIRDLAAELFRPEQASLTLLGPVASDIDLEALLAF